MSELTTMRDAAETAKAGTKHAISQKTAPNSVAIQRTGRPWNKRAPLQIMPTATNKRMVERLAGQRRCDQLAELPECAGGAADQISRAPPGQRADALLRPGVQQKQAEQRCDANGDDEQGSDIERHQCWRQIHRDSSLNQGNYLSRMRVSR